MEIGVLTSRKIDSFLKNRNCIHFSNLQEALEFKPTFAIVANSTENHIDTSIILAKNHINLFVEKPLSNSYEKIETLKKLIKKNNLVFYLGTNLSFHPCLKKLKELIKRKKIGKLLSIYVENGSYLPDWHKNEDYSTSYAADEKRSGGIILTNFHEIDYVCWFFGLPTHVFSITEKLSTLKISSSDTSNILLKFRQNFIANIHLDFYQKSNFRCCKVVGTNGILYWNDNENIVSYFNNKTSKWENLMSVKNFNINDTYMEEVKHFITNLKKRKKSENSINEHIKTLNIALKIKQSSKLKKMVKIND